MTKKSFGCDCLFDALVSSFMALTEDRPSPTNRLVCVNEGEGYGWIYRLNWCFSRQPLVVALARVQNALCVVATEGGWLMSRVCASNGYIQVGRVIADALSKRMFWQAEASNIIGDAGEIRF